MESVGGRLTQLAPLRMPRGLTCSGLYMVFSFHYITWCTFLQCLLVPSHVCVNRAHLPDCTENKSYNENSGFVREHPASVAPVLICTRSSTKSRPTNNLSVVHDLLHSLTYYGRL